MVYGTWLFGTVIFLVVRGVVPDWSFPEVCAPKKTVKLDPLLPKSTHIPKLPVLPGTFQVQVEAKLLDRKLTKNGKIYYDEGRRQATVELFDKNQTTRSIFDFALNQTIFINNGSCYVRDYLTTDQSILIGAKQTGHSTSGTLNFDIANGLLYKGNKYVRGINCDWWQSCISWAQANFTLDYYFSVYDPNSPFSSSQVPVLAEIIGSKYMIPNDLPIHHTYEYFDFRSNIWADDSVFEIPSGMVCPGLPISRDIPTLPEQFSFREEILDMNFPFTKGINNGFVYYDHKAKTVIYEVKDPNEGNDVVYTLQDFKSGIQYSVNTDTGNCTTSSLSNSSLSATWTENKSGKNYIKLESAQAFFYLDNTTYTYTGKRTVRGISCKVFISRKTDLHIQGFRRFNTIFELYFLDDNWSGPNDTAIPIQMRLITPDRITFKFIYNFYDFTVGPRLTERFSISSCFNAKMKTSFWISFPGLWDNSLLSPQKMVLSNITEMISRLSHVPILRVQDRQLIISNDSFHFIATLLDKAPSMGNTQFKDNSMSMAAAMKELKNVVVIGYFSFTLAINGQLRTVTADSIEDNLFKSESMSTKSVMDKFTVQRNKGVFGYDDIILTGYSIDECATECLNTKPYVCNAFTYSFSTGYCICSKLRPNEKPEIIKTITNSFLFIKKYTVDYERIAGILDLPTSGINFQNINSAESCARLCSNYTGFNCKSFDFCDTVSTCSLGRSRYNHIPTAKTGMSANCSHYSRKYLADFKKVGNLSVTNAQMNVHSLLVRGVSVDQCAKLCVEEEGADCASIVYCPSTTECRLSTTTMWNVSEVIPQSSAICNVYNLPPSGPTQTMSTSSTKSTASSGSTKSTIPSVKSNSMTTSTSKMSVSSNASNSLATATVITPTNLKPSSTKATKDGKNSKQSSSEKDITLESKSPTSINKGLSAGAVVGVAFGMMISGILIAALTYAGIILIQRRKHDEMKTRLTEHELS